MSKPKRKPRTVTLAELAALVERRNRPALDAALPTPTTVTLNATVPGNATVTGNAK